MGEKNADLDQHLTEKSGWSKMKEAKTDSQHQPRGGCHCKLEKILVFVGAFYQDCLFGATLAWSSIFYVEWMDYFNTKKGPTAWVTSINISSIFIFGVVYSFLIGKFSCRFVGMCGGLLACLAALASSFANGLPALCITYGFLNGFGVGMMFLSSIVIIQQHFHKRRAIAGAFAMSGASIGALAAGYGVPYLIGKYGWRGAFFVVAGFLLNGVAAGALYIPFSDERSGKGCLSMFCNRGKSGSLEVQTEEEQETQGAIYRPKNDVANKEGVAHEEYLLKDAGADSKLKPPAEDGAGTKSANRCGWIYDVFDFTLLKDTRFVLYLMGTFTFNICMNLVMQHLPSAANFKGVDKDKAGMLISIIGLSTIPSYLATGLIGTLKGVNSVLLYGVTVCITGTVGSLMFLVHDFQSMCIFAVAFGAAYSSPIAIQPTAMVDLMGLDSIVKAAGFNCLFMGTGCLISVPFAGFLVDVTKNYNVPYAIGGTIGIIGGIMTCLVLPLQRRQAAKAALEVDVKKENATTA